MKKAVLFIFILLLTSLLWAQSQSGNRHALVIGNADYPKVDDRLPNAINDTNDISAALEKLGYQVVLKQNLSRLSMIQEIDAFIARLKSNRTNSEGFFWYAGHAMLIDGDSVLLPLDVNLESESLIEYTSYKVASLTKGLEAVKNKVNVVVLDACRVPPAVGGGTRNMGDTSRVIKPVTIPSPDLFVIYSTAPGTVAYDGKGKPNSPFTEAFLKHIESTEPLTMMIEDVGKETRALTNQFQTPFLSRSLGGEHGRYSLNPAGVRPAPTPQGSFTMRGKASQEIQTDGLTARHPSFPLNSKVKVTNPRNGKEIEVTIIGRIDPSVNRIIDLSRSALEALELNSGEEVVITVR
ncbi:MAG: caspase family protein [Treponema sp.]|jgi:hypothetical protein|nr:caspase family protein [Treponema sp.]